jgi:D-alanyl-lipoteichoic acid acyltransferase DltB (MBOAT superfamily)
MAFIPAFILILAITIIIDYFAGIWIENSQGKKRKIFLIISIIATCLVLFIFKYINFFNSSFASIAAFFHWNYPIEIINIILPIGLSFHTFQSLSYVIEVYRGNQKAEKHFGIYSLYVMFYPQLVAGPIERPQNLLHQFREEHNFDYKRVTNGLKLMTWGLFKKVVIADRLAVVVNQVYESPTEFTGFILILATVFFAFQIYCDFSGYSDIAIGAAQVMGFKLMDNFKRPYFSKNISEFWKRWHISLSTWFKDYLYISMGGNKVSKCRWYFNLFITFTISGLWHGANWTFVFWGALNGFYLVFAIWTKEVRETIAERIGLTKFPSIRKFWQVSVTFLLICIAWTFFRAKNMSDAWYIITHFYTGFEHIFSLKYFNKNIEGLALSKFEILLAVLSILFMECVHLLQRSGSIRNLVSEKPIWVRWSIYYLIIIVIILLGVLGDTDFIYFQF